MTTTRRLSPPWPPTRPSTATHRHAATTLTRHPAQLAAYAADSTADSYDRASAADGLAAIAPELAAEVLAVLAADPTIEYSYARLMAARTLSQLDASRGAQALAAIADPKADSDDRRYAAEELGGLDLTRGVQELRRLATDTTMKRHERRRSRRAARTLRRRPGRAALVATATATLMCADGWFDLCTSAPGHPFACAVAEATAELMAAAVCLVMGQRTQQDADGRPSDDLRLPAGPAVARRGVPLSAPGPGPM